MQVVKGGFFVVLFLLLIRFVLVGVAFLVLLKHRVLGYVHIRKGPNRVGFVGLFQTFSDAVKFFLVPSSRKCKYIHHCFLTPSWRYA
jgi:NADH:ubiquinone oxidoreductase subunit H